MHADTDQPAAFGLYPRLWCGLFSAVLIWSAIAPKDGFTWLLEVLPALIGIVLLALTRKHFPLTPLLYVLILVHSIVLMIGGHYTYAEVPLFDWLKEPLGFERNHYDKVGHFMQGFAPAILAREILLRLAVVNGRRWTVLMVISLCLAFSAFYELLEWWVAELSGTAAEAFLGTQGYIWDTQSDMAFALIGAMSALICLSNWHDRQISKLLRCTKPSPERARAS